jgi:hypothetical protein
LQVKAGKIVAENLRPRQKEADAQTEGSQIYQLCAAQTDGLKFQHGISRGGFRFRFYGNLVGHSNFLLVTDCERLEQNPVDTREDAPVDETAEWKKSSDARQ